MTGIKPKWQIAISTFSLATFAILPLLNLIIIHLIGLDEGLLSTLYTINVVLVVLSSLMYCNKFILPWPSFWFILITLLVTFVLTQGSILPSTLKFNFFVICTIFAFVTPQLLSIDSKLMIQLMVLLPAFGIFFLNSFIADDGSVKMNVTYAFLVPIISSVVYLFTYIKEDKGKKKILMTIVIFVNFVYFIMCLLLGSRAPSMSVLLCVFFFLCTNKKELGFTFRKQSWIYLILPLVVVLNFRTFLLLLQNTFDYFGWKADTVERLIALDELGMLDSGRSDINILAFKGIGDSPLWGHGMSTSERFTGFDYPHNFLLQLLLDGGIILFVSIIYPLIYRILRVKKTCSYSEFTLLSALFFASVPAALFSLDLWENATFWLFMGFLFSKKFHVISNQSAQ